MDGPFVSFVLRQKELGGQSVDTVRFSFQIGSGALISGVFLFLDFFVFLLWSDSSDRLHDL